MKKEAAEDCCDSATTTMGGAFVGVGADDDVIFF